MGLLDGLIGNVLGSMLGTKGKGKIHSALSWVVLAAVTSNRAGICSFNWRYRCYSKMAGWRELLASFVRAASRNKRTPG